MHEYRIIFNNIKIREYIILYFNGQRIPRLKWIKARGHSIFIHLLQKEPSRLDKGVCPFRGSIFKGLEKVFYVRGGSAFSAVHVNVKYRLHWPTRHKDLHRSTTGSFCTTLCSRSA